MFLKIGHRGACGYAPENTISSFRKAIELKVDMIELDIHKTKDGNIVVIHDETLDRMTNGKGFIKDKKYSDINRLIINPDEKIPTLENVLSFIDRKVKVNIEIKSEDIAQPLWKLLEHFIKIKGWDYKNFLISSFNYNELEKIRKMDQKIEIGVLMHTVPDNLMDIVNNIHPQYINIFKGVVNKNFVEFVHNLGLGVLVWTVDSTEEIKKIVNMGVDGIFSNFPDRLNLENIS